MLNRKTLVKKLDEFGKSEALKRKLIPFKSLSHKMGHFKIGIRNSGFMRRREIEFAL